MGPSVSQAPPRLSTLLGGVGGFRIGVGKRFGLGLDSDCFIVGFTAVLIFNPLPLVLGLVQVSTNLGSCQARAPPSDVGVSVAKTRLSSALRAAAEASGASDTAAQRAEELQQQLAALKLEVETPRGGSSCHKRLDIYYSHSFQGSFFPENLKKPRENGRCLQRTMIENNGESTPGNVCMFKCIVISAFVRGTVPGARTHCYSVHGKPPKENTPGCIQKIILPTVKVSLERQSTAMECQSFFTMACGGFTLSKLVFRSRPTRRRNPNRRDSD